MSIYSIAAAVALTQLSPLTFAEAQTVPNHATSQLQSAAPLALIPALTLDLPAPTNTPDPKPQPSMELALGDLSCQHLTPEALNRLTLIDTARQVICSSPLVGQAVQLVNEQAAGVDLAQSAYQPRFNGGVELSTNRIPSIDSGVSSTNSRVVGSLGMTWVVIDGGVRAANLAQSQLQLSAAEMARQSAALAALNQALQLFVDASSARARLLALREAEAVARTGMRAAQAKHEALVGSLSDKLLAQTALAQATLARVRAESVWAIARESLAQAMGLPLDQPLTLAPIEAAFPTASTPAINQDSISEIYSSHPRVRRVVADILALKARLDALYADYKGTISISASMTGNRDFDVPHAPFEKRLGGAIYATLPLFTHRELQARVKQVLAQIASRETLRVQVEREVAAEIWRNARQTDADRENLKASDGLLRVAVQSHEIALGRYKAGVSSILELLAAQVSLADAHAQLAQAQLSVWQSHLKLSIARGAVSFRP